VARQLVQNAVVYAQFKGRRGHPVGFSAELYSELVTLDGDEGARRLVSRYPSLGLEVNDPGVLVDVDTLADLESVRAAHVDVAAPAPRW
jgi:molybdenum cofactor cytidylyltransferase